ncbi:hypothetical protein ACWFR5_22370 [Streptomyces sp. NPDC055092]
MQGRVNDRAGTLSIFGQELQTLDVSSAERTGAAPVQLALGWDLHEYRHSGLTHLGEQGASLPMLMAKSRHKKPENVRNTYRRARSTGRGGVCVVRWRRRVRR